MRRLRLLEQFFLYSFLILGLTGCPGPGRQPTAWIDSFASNRTSRDEIRKAFLECGANVPGDTVEYRTPDGKFFPEMGLNENILVVKCMERSGFTNNAYIPCRGWSENGKHVPNNLPACQPDAVIPKRSVENRLNSLYCKYYPKVPMCQPAYDPRVPQAQLQTPDSPQSVQMTSNTGELTTSDKKTPQLPGVQMLPPAKIKELTNESWGFSQPVVVPPRAKPAQEGETK